MSLVCACVCVLGEGGKNGGRGGKEAGEEERGEGGKEGEESRRKARCTYIKARQKRKIEKGRESDEREA